MVVDDASSLLNVRVEREFSSCQYMQFLMEEEEQEVVVERCLGKVDALIEVCLMAAEYCILCHLPSFVPSSLLV